MMTDPAVGGSTPAVDGEEWAFENDCGEIRHVATEAQARDLAVRFNGTARVLHNGLWAKAPAVPDSLPPDPEPCRSELHSWAYFNPNQTDSYWMRCHLIGPHDEHENSETGATWRDDHEPPPSRYREGAGT